MQPLVPLTGVAALALGGWAVVRLVRNQPVIGKQLIGAAVVETLMLLACAAAIAAQASGRVNGDTVVMWGYLITALLLVPAASAWAFADRTRTSSAALLVACATVAVMMWRTLQVAMLA